MSNLRGGSNLQNLRAPQRAAASVPGNISEGCGKRTLPQLRNSLDIAGGSLSELEYWFILGRDLGYLSSEIYEVRSDQLNEVRRLLLGFTDWSSV
jgi:four helix bundle protein